MRVTAVLLALLVSHGTDAQVPGAVLDALTAEPIPAAMQPPSEQPVSGASVEAAHLLAHFSAGSTRAVRFREDGLVVVQDGASIVLAEIVSPGDGGDPAFLVLDRLTLDARPQDIITQDDRIYVATRGEGGVKIVVVSENLELELAGTIGGFDALGLTVAGYDVFVAAGADGVRLHWVVHPMSPQFYSTFSTGGSANGIDLEGDRLFVANGSPPEAYSLPIYDVSDPTEPALLGGLHVQGFVTNVAVEQHVAYLAGEFGVLAVDVSNPAEPVVVDVFDTGGDTTFEVAVRGAWLVASGSAGLYHFDVSDPHHLALVALHPLDGQGTGVDLHPSAPFAILGDRFEGARYLELSDAEPPLEQAFYRNGGFSHKVALDGDHLYVTDLFGRLRVVDISAVPGGPPIELARLDMPPATQQVLVDGGIAYVTDADGPGSGLTVVDVGDPAAPVVITSWASTGEAFGLDKAGDVLFLATGSTGLKALDVSNPTSPILLGTFQADSPVVDVGVHEDVAYIATQGGGMIALDISDPADITLLDARPEWGVLNAIGFGIEPYWYEDVALLADAEHGLRAVDISEPHNLQTLYTLQTVSEPRDVSSGFWWFGHYPAVVHFVAADFHGLQIFWEGYSAGLFPSADRGLGIATREVAGSSWVALAAGEVGVYLLREPTWVGFDESTTTSAANLDPVFPNPSAGRARVTFTLTIAAEVSLEVFDILGRRIAEVATGWHEHGRHEMTLDTRRYPNGTYLVRLLTPAGSHSQVFTVVR